MISNNAPLFGVNPSSVSRPICAGVRREADVAPTEENDGVPTAFVPETASATLTTPRPKSIVAAGGSTIVGVAEVVGVNGAVGELVDVVPVGHPLAGAGTMSPSWPSCARAALLVSHKGTITPAEVA